MILGSVMHVRQGTREPQHIQGFCIFYRHCSWDVVQDSHAARSSHFLTPDRSPLVALLCLCVWLMLCTSVCVCTSVFVCPPPQVTQRPGQDNLAMNAIRFLTTVAKSVHCKLFADATVLKQVCESIILPNLRVSECE